MAARLPEFIQSRRKLLNDQINNQVVLMVPFDSDKIEGSIRSGDIPLPRPVDGTEEPEFEIPVSRSNQLNPERRAREFRARHIQMMALGKKT